MNRDRILEAAAQIFATKGFHAASMQDIAEAVSLQKGSLYHHVSSKQEILAEILDRALDLLTERFVAVTGGQEDPLSKFRLAVRSYVQSMSEFRDPASVLLLEYRSLTRDLQQQHIVRRDRYEQLWRTLIEDGCTSGVFWTADPAMSSRAILGALGWVITWYRPEGKLTADEIADLYSELFLSGLQQRVNGNG